MFDKLDLLESKLQKPKFLTGARHTVTDWRLFITLVSFDPIYVGHFECNIRRLADYPNLSGYVRDLYQRPGIAATVDFSQIKNVSLRQSKDQNPSRVVTVEPIVNHLVTHDRKKCISYKSLKSAIITIKSKVKIALHEEKLAFGGVEHAHYRLSAVRCMRFLLLLSAQAKAWIPHEATI